LVHKGLFVLFFTLLVWGKAFSQKRDSVSQKLKADSLLFSSDLLSDSDSLSIFQLIDSLLKAPAKQETGSALAVRAGYNSNVVSSGRPFGFDQFGLTSGLSYYHKSGFYLDATGYWSQQYDPNYYLTIASAGFFNSLKKWTYNLEYSRYLYNTPSGSDVYNPYTNLVGISNFLNVKPFIFRLDYSVYFGDKSAQRLMPAIMINFTKKNWLGFSKISFFPTFTMLAGTEVIDRTRIRLIRLTPPTYAIVTTSKTEFGVMNYSVSFPLSLSIKNWSFLVNYSYNFPQALPGEQISLANSGYITASIVRYVNFKSAKLNDLLNLPK
jgi:hypothetical protein